MYFFEYFGIDPAKMAVNFFLLVITIVILAGIGIFIYKKILTQSKFLFPEILLFNKKLKLHYYLDQAEKSKNVIKLDKIAKKTCSNEYIFVNPKGSFYEISENKKKEKVISNLLFNTHLSESSLIYISQKVKEKILNNSLDVDIPLTYRSPIFVNFVIHENLPEIVLINLTNGLIEQNTNKPSPKFVTQLLTILEHKNATKKIYKLIGSYVEEKNFDMFYYVFICQQLAESELTPVDILFKLGNYRIFDIAKTVQNNKNYNMDKYLEDFIEV